MPHDVSQPWRRYRSVRRSGDVATSMLPTLRKHHCPASVSPSYFSTVYRANSVIVFEPFVWNTSPGAWLDEPPAAQRVPWSTTVTSVQPRAVSSSARFAPTIPAPMIATLGPATSALALQGCGRVPAEPADTLRSERAGPAAQPAGIHAFHLASFALAQSSAALAYRFAWSGSLTYLFVSRSATMFWSSLVQLKFLMTCAAAPPSEMNFVDAILFRSYGG